MLGVFWLKLCVNWMCRKWNLSDLDYVLNRINQGLLPIWHKLVLSDLFLLNKIPVDQKILIPFAFCKIISHDSNTRSSSNVSTNARMRRRMRQKHCEENNFIRVAKYSNAFSFSYNLSCFKPISKLNLPQVELYQDGGNHVWFEFSSIINILFYYFVNHKITNPFLLFRKPQNTSF